VGSGPVAHKAAWVLALWRTRPSSLCPCGTQGHFYWPCGTQGQVLSGLVRHKARTVAAFPAVKDARVPTVK